MGCAFGDCSGSREAVSRGFAALVSSVPGDRPEQLKAHLAAAVEAGEDVARLAVLHGLGSLLFMRVEEAAAQELLPEAQMERLRQAHLATISRQARFYTAGADIAQTMTSAGVEGFLPIKGLAIAATWWPDYLPRDMADIDVLVAVEQFDRAMAALEEAGFACTDPDWLPNYLAPHAPRLRKGGVDVEVHWTLWVRGSLLLAAPPSAEALLARADQATLDRTVLRVPSREDCLIIQAADLATSAFWSNLRSWGDIYWLMTHPRSAPDWNLMHDMAEELGLSGVVYLVVRFATELYGIDNPCAGWIDNNTEGTYEQLKAIIWRRLLAGRNHPKVPQPVRLAAEWVVRRSRSSQGGEGWPDHAPVYMQPPQAAGLVRSLLNYGGGPWVAGLRMGGFLLHLLTSSEQRRVLGEEIRMLRALAKMP